MLHAKFRGNRPAGSGVDQLAHLYFVSALVLPSQYIRNTDGETPSSSGEEDS